MNRLESSSPKKKTRLFHRLLLFQMSKSKHKPYFFELIPPHTYNKYPICRIYIWVFRVLFPGILVPLILMSKHPCLSVFLLIRLYHPLPIIIYPCIFKDMWYSLRYEKRNSWLNYIFIIKFNYLYNIHNMDKEYAQYLIGETRKNYRHTFLYFSII